MAFSKEKYLDLRAKRLAEQQAAGNSFAEQRQKLREKRQQIGISTKEPLSAVESTQFRGIPGVSAVDVLQRSVQQQTAQKLQQLAQQKEAEEENKRTWLQSGAMDDDAPLHERIGKTILGTGQDIGDNLLAGVLDMGEKAVDAGAYVVGGAGKIFGADGFADDMKAFIQKDLYDAKSVAQKINSYSLFNVMGADAEENSILGDKSDSLIQSAGQLGATAGLQMVGVPWFVTTGLTSFGGEVEGAFNEGATYGQTGLSAAISAGAEILTEKISGGIKFGGKTLDDAITKKLASGISSKAVRFLAKLGIDMAGEGGEEVLSGAISKFGQWLTYQDDQTLGQMLFSEEALDEALESFIGGALLGGFGSVAQGVDKQSAYDRVQDLLSIVKEKPAQQTAQTGKLEINELVDEVIAKNTGAPADPVGAAVESFATTGTVSNKQATDILNSVKAVQSLVQETGVKLDGLTMSQRRNAVKTAVEQMAQEQASTESTSSTETTESNGIKEQLRSQQDTLNNMQPAVEIQAPAEFSGMDKAGKQNWVVEKLRPTGYKVDRKGFGIIDFAKKRLKAAFKYFDSGSAEEASFEAIPYVLESGIEISSHADHKGRNYRTVTIAAPVVVNGKRGNMAVVVKQTDGNHYKVHRILTPDGSVFQLSETTNEADRADGGVTETGSLATSNGAASSETGVLGSSEAGHRQTQTLIPDSNTIIPNDSETVNTENDTAPAVAKVLTETPKADISKRSLWSWTKEKVLDKGMVFEDLALKTKNRELQAKWNSTRYAQSRAQWLIGNGAENTKSLNAIREEVEKTGKTSQFSEYLYHKHNIDRMQLEARFEDAKNKPVFGDTITAEVSQRYVEQCEKENPAFTQLAEDVYSYMNHLRQLMVDNGVISQDTADLWAQMYPHYVPISRLGKSGRSIDVPLDTGRTGVNAPVKRATGGSSDILPLFDTIAQRTLQTYTAIARNSFGVELKNTLGSVVERSAPNVDEAITSVDAQEGLLQKGDTKTNPTFTVFENGERVTFEITDEMYDALKPTSQGMAYTNKVTNAISNFHRGLLTEYNPTFMLTNAIKDVQDVILNSQHPAKTYAKIPQAYVELAKKGKWYTEYVANGGEQNTYFNSETNTFEAENKGLKKLLETPPLGTISKLNSFIEMAPRLAEYIASREAGSSIDVAMLDAARVTTNFAAGGDLTKLLNRNGATFLNASVQGVVQQARNFREAKMNGAKGWVSLATKFTLAGLPGMLLNGLIWDNDEDYAELSDYVKDNYYIVGKYGDGQFVRIPKGRVTAVIQSAIEQISNTVTGNDEADWQRFAELVISNLAPNNPVDNNVLSPIIQAANNKTWYGEDLVPTRLQNLPAAEQYDESTDTFSRWLGEKLNISPVKIHYLLDQYGGGVADTVLPMLTPKAEGGDNSVAGKLLAPLKDKFTTDSVLNNQNITDFYDKLDELTTNAKASTATVEDKIIYKYINSVNAELRNLYAEKREVQSSDLPDDQKYAKVRNVQQKIADVAKEALAACQNPYSADKSGMVAGVIGDVLSDLTDCWKNGADTVTATAAIEKAYDAYSKMDINGQESVKAEGGRVRDYLTARESGISTKVFTDLYETYYRIDKGNGNASAKASQWSYELEKAQEQGTITSSQKAALKEEMNFWQMIPAKTSRFDALTKNGLSADKASYVDELLDSILPPAGKSGVTQQQKVQAVTSADSRLSDKEQQQVLKEVLSESAYGKYLEILELGYSNDDYSDSYRIYTKEKDTGGERTKARTIEAFRKEFGISEAAATALYEIYVPK